MPVSKLCPPERLQKRPLPAIKIRNDDTFIVSYPRSGNTWIRFLLANLLVPDKTITFRNIEEYVPSIYKSAAMIERHAGRRYIKSHNPCFELYPKMIYAYRDGRDALVSYYKYARGKKVFFGTFEQFVSSDFVNQFGSWREHVTGGLDFAAKYPDRTLILRYEEMLTDPLPALSSISTFVGLQREAEAMAKAAEKSSFPYLQKMERTSGGETLGKRFTFFRAGRNEQWQDYFNPELYRRYLRANGETLRRLGYHAP
jgi:estrone sulfotransferase